jgi:hypothetical protein
MPAYLAPALCVVAAILFLIEAVRSNGGLTPIGLMLLSIAGAVVTA